LDYQTLSEVRAIFLKVFPVCEAMQRGDVIIDV